MAGKELSIILSGFGGQGLLFAGKVIAQAGLLENRYVSWLPSYGPEMRGGTASCSVVLSDDPVGSPLVTTPNVLIAMNQPSIDKYLDTVESGGLILADSSMIQDMPSRDDVTIHEVPATNLAYENGFKTLANIILTGKLFAETSFCEKETLFKAIEKCVPASKQEMIAMNTHALEVGMSL